MTTHPFRLWRCSVSAKSKTKFKDEDQKHIPTSIETFVMQICPRWYAIPLNFLSLLVVLYALAAALKFSGAVPDLKERSFVLAVVRPFSCTKSVAPRSRKLHLNSSFDTQTLERGSVGIHTNLQSINLSSQSFVQNPESRPWTLVNLGFISLFWHFIGVRYHFGTRLSHIIIIWAPPIFLSHQNYIILITYYNNSTAAIGRWAFLLALPFLFFSVVSSVRCVQRLPADEAAMLLFRWGMGYLGMYISINCGQLWWTVVKSFSMLITGFSYGVAGATN